MAEATGRIGQAQGSTGHSWLATAMRATDPTMEQGLEAPAPGADEGGKPSSRCTDAKGEGARHAVKGASSDGRDP
jgi:hypothetical protein